MYALKVDEKILGVTRDRIVEALIAEGLNVSNKYQNIHLLPTYQKKIAFGSKGFPWNSEFCKREVDYSKGICPNAEYLNDHAYIGLGMCVYDLTIEDIELIIEAFNKVWVNLDNLRNI